MEIQIENVSKSYNNVAVLDNVSLGIDTGTILCLLGPSGCGKTTLIRIVMGALNADQGHVRIGEYLMPSLKALNHIGYMPQSDGLYVDISGRDNLLFYGRLYNIPAKELLLKADRLLEMLDLVIDQSKAVANYSGGMKKRLSLAIALLHEPDVLVLDEPTVGIDPLLKRVIWSELSNLSKNGKTIIVTTHVMDEVKECDNASLLYNSHLIENDTVPELISKCGGAIEDLFVKQAERMI
jgi:ABC-2 type transport system ATP-binding protein